MKLGGPQILLRNKAAQEAASEGRMKLGKRENLSTEGWLRGAAATKQATINGYRTTLGYIKLLREQDVSYDHIAKKLNAEGHRTRQGKQFKAMTVYRIVQRSSG